MSKNTMPADIVKLEFEAALDELEKIIRDLEMGESGLEASIKSYTRGTLLKRHCEEKLKEAQLRIDKITVTDSDEIAIDPIDTI